MAEIHRAVKERVIYNGVLQTLVNTHAMQTQALAEVHVKIANAKANANQERKIVLSLALF